MKFWFFVEGESELALARQVIRLVHAGAVEEKSLVRFVTDPVSEKVVFNVSGHSTPSFPPFSKVCDNPQGSI